MKKLLLSLALSASVVMASDMPKDDLLSMATMGKTTGTQFEMNKSEMKDAVGGASYWTKRVYGNPYNVYYPRYSTYRYSGRYYTISIRR